MRNHATHISLSLLVFLLALAGSSQSCAAQYVAQDGVYTANDTLEQAIHSPTKAAMLSATLPGLGQIYNRKYWKVPIIYAGFGAVIYFADFNGAQYRKWRGAYMDRVSEDPTVVDQYPTHSTHILERNMDLTRRYLEITYMLGAALYLLNILDATVDAHLMDFDVGEQLSLRMNPSLNPTGYGRTTHAPGIKLTLSF